MILILGRKDDLSTTEIAEWLLFYKKDFVILNTDEVNYQILSYSYESREFIILVNGREYNLFDTSSVWNRRWGLSPSLYTKFYLKDDNAPFFMDPNDTFHCKHLKEESSTLFAFLHYFIEKEAVHVIGSFFTNDVNKLIVLDKAKTIGLSVPISKIITNKKDLALFIDRHKNVITKAMYEGIYRPDVRDKYLYYSFVERITKDKLSQLPDTFYPSLVQEEIDKEYDLRVFYLNGLFYSMAIFSQDEEGAIVDFRKNDHQNHPLKCVPYLLPDDIAAQLKHLMNLLGLTTGSIDLVLSKQNIYYFLEVNPCGQFKMTSVPCNYFLEKQIAKAL